MTKESLTIISGECPEEMFSNMMTNIKVWLDQKPVKELLCLYGARDLDDSDLGAYLDFLYSFIDVWDYRRLQSRTSLYLERWQICNDEFTVEHLEEVKELIDSTDGIMNDIGAPASADYVLVAGGGQRANSLRAMFADQHLSDTEIYESSKPSAIVGLSGDRPITPYEKKYSDTYTRTVNTEFDSLSMALEEVFGVEQREDRFYDEAPDKTVCIRNFGSSYKGINIYNINTPGSVPGKRADTRDTIECFSRYFKVDRGETILLCSNQPYVIYQFFTFVDYAMEHGINIECGGIGCVGNQGQLSAAQYLQELRSIIRCMYDFYHKYRHLG